MFKNPNETIRFKNFKGKDSFQAFVKCKDYDRGEILTKVFNKDDINNFCEWTDYKDKVKPFYDLDKKYYGAKGEIEYQTDQDRIKDEFYNECLKLFPNCDIAITESHGKKKDNKRIECLAVSYHFVINNYETSIPELRKFNEWNNIYKRFDYVDKNVYKDGGLFRTVLSNKPGDKRTKKPIKRSRLLFKYLITSNSYTNKEFKKIILSPSPAVSPVGSPRKKEVIEEKIILPKCDKETFIKHMKSFKPRFDYADWLDIGYICYNNFDGSDIGFNIWNDYSKEDNKRYELKALIKQWTVFEKQYDKNKNKLSYKRLIKYHDEDYPCKNKYEKYYKEGRLVEEMNKEIYFYIPTSDFIYFTDEKTYYINKEKVVKLYYTKYKFRIEYMDDDGKKKKKDINPFIYWLENINRKDVNEIIFDPSTLEQKNNTFNTWSGFDYNENNEEVDYKKIEGFLFHIKDVLADGDDIQAEYILNWFAHIIQRPYKRTNTCLVFQSIEGVGKTIILDIIGKLLGSKYYLSTNALESVLGHFTSSGANKLLINFNETNWGGDHKMEGKFKSLITDDMYKVELKGKDPYYINNLSNSVITSNKDWLVSMTKSDRRFNVMRCKNEKLSKDKYLKIRDTDLQHLFNYFMNRNINNFDPSIYKKTEYAQEQIEMNYDSVQIFWNNFINDEYPIITKEKFMDKKELYDTYINETVASHSHKFNNVIFWKKIRKLCPSAKFHKAGKNKQPRIEIPEDNILISEFENCNY